MVYLSLGPHTREHMIGMVVPIFASTAPSKWTTIYYRGGLTQFVYFPRCT